MSTSTKNPLPLQVTLEVRDTCLCFRLQRAARNIARYFDEALRPIGLSHGQFSLLVATNRPDAPTINQLAEFLGMDRTTLTANLKPLQRRSLVELRVDEEDRRNRRLFLTQDAHVLLHEATPVWRQAHASLDQWLETEAQEQLRAYLAELTDGITHEQ